MAIDYASPGPLTTLDGVDPSALTGIATDPVGICAPVHRLVIQPTDPQTSLWSEQRRSENNIRPIAALVERLLAYDPAPLSEARAPENRVVGTCRHFAVLSCALLRYRGIPARARCGFATYFQPGKGVDHWITEYRDSRSQAWIRLDSEIFGQAIVERPQNLTPDQFLTGGEAWAAYREGRIDAATFGVFGTENWGPSEIRGNAVRDLAALNKIEMLPWDEWGRMTDAYDGTTGPDYDDLLDSLAAICHSGDTVAIEQLFRHPDLAVPARDVL